MIEGNILNRMMKLWNTENLWDITYKKEAIGWKDGIYYPRERKEELGKSFVKDTNGLIQIHSRVWREIENTGYGIYYYEETTGIRQIFSKANYEVKITLENPTKKPYEMHARVNGIIKADDILVKPGESKQISFLACMTDGTFFLTLAAGALDKITDQVLEGDIYIREITALECEEKQPRQKNVLYLASDSTVQTYEKIFYPQTGWGQVLYEFFQKEDTHREEECMNCCYPQARIYETESVVIENRAIGGRSAKSFLEEGKLDSILEKMCPGDYLFVQFAHNDNTAIRPNRYTPPQEFAVYLEHYIKACERRGAICVLVTPVAMRNCKEGGNFSISFAPYREQMLQISEKQNIPLLDLGKKSTEYLNAIGEEASKNLYLWVEPEEYPDGAYKDGVSDNAHLKEYGARVYANMVAQLIASYEKDDQLKELKQYVHPISQVPKPKRHFTKNGNIITPKDAVMGFAMQEFSIERGMAYFLLTWNSVKDAISYHVYAKIKEELTYHVVKRISKEEKEMATTLPFTAPANRIYHYYVTAVFSNGREGTASRVIEIST